LIPFLGNRDSLENTLASVLQNRPEDAEIVVALGQEYDDPYQLGEEVRFVGADAATGLIPVLNRGFEACRAPIVHTLACGAAVCDGWADQALKRFVDRRVASVAPLIVQAEEPQRIWAAGLEYLSGESRPRGQGVLADSLASVGGRLIGPSIVAGFYRRAALGDGRLPFDPELGPSFADADLALRLFEAGYSTACEPESLVLQPQPPARAGGWRHARQAERLFWRHAHEHGRVRSLAAHLLAVAREFVRSAPHPRAFAQLGGRCLAGCEWGAMRRGRQWSIPPFNAAETEPSGKRIDALSPERGPVRPHFELESRERRAESLQQRGASS
jgi:hypothetical protein